jgi:voltage-gated potassium channel
MRIRREIYEVLKISERKGSLSWKFDVFLITLILLNVVVLVIETVESIYNSNRFFFHIFNWFSVIVFTIEYLLRLWSIVENSRCRHPITGRLRFMLSPLGLIDLMAIVPFYLPFLGVDLRFVRILRIFRLFRIFRVAKYIKALDIIRRVIRDRKEELLVSLVFVSFLLIISSCVIYYVEHDAQPDAFSSIPATMWWSIATLTTVGYGDIYPVTPLGRFLGSIIAVLGVGLFALPTGILASGFSEEISKKKHNPDTCPTCGQQVSKDKAKSKETNQTTAS